MHSKLKRGVLYGCAAAVLYGAIAVVSHWGYETGVIIKAALSHGIFCFVMTCISTMMMEFFFSLPSKAIYKYFASNIIPGLINLSLMLGVHYLMGTPEIFKTIFPSVITSLPYYLLFPLKLLHEWKSKKNPLAYRDDVNWKREWGIGSFSMPYSLKDFLICVKHNLTSPSSKYKNLTSYIPQSSTLNIIDPKVKLGFLGDLMPLLNANWIISDEAKLFFSDIDYLICNFEGVLFKANKWVTFKLVHNKEDILLKLQEFLPANKIVLSFANNHSADGGYSNYLKTIERLRSMGFMVIGEREDPGIILDNAINIVAATKWSNQAHGYLSFLEHSDKHYNPKAKFNLLYPHWGYELELYPRPDFIDEAKYYLKKWDGIIGHHSHMPAPVTNENGKILAYSLGDSVTGLSVNHYQHGIALKMEVGPNTEGDWKVGKLDWRYSKINKENKNLNYTLSSEFSFKNK